MTLTDPTAGASSARSSRTRPDRETVSVASLLLVAAGLALLALGEQTSTNSAAGALLSVGGVLHLVVASDGDRWRSGNGLVVVGIVAGVSLLSIPDAAEFVLTTLSGAALVALGVREAARSLRLGRSWGRVLTRGTLLLPIGLALAFLSGTLVRVGLVVGSALIVVYVVIWNAARLGLTHVDESEESRPLLISWLAARGDQSQERQHVVDSLYFEGDHAAARSMRFGLMMLFASIISAMGVIGDSTAVVVGAMLIAPLISPMMGMALSLASGWPRRLGRSFLTVLAGIFISIGSGSILSAVFGAAVDLETNTQVTSRASPTLSDLMIAVAAGGAGAYVLSRRDVSSSLPGVAIAIALVPPLSVVGIALEQGAGVQALGTLLLFLTNLAAILLVGAVVFVLTGVASGAHDVKGRSRVRTSLLAALTLALFVAVALSLNSARIVEDSLAGDDVRSSIADWLGPDTDFSIVSVEISEETVTVILVGPGTPPSAERLATEIGQDLDRSITLDLQWVPRERTVVTSP